MPELAAAGWHGKLPTLGDFATRRLAPEFIEAWDHWLSDGLAAMRLQPDWLEAYLASPSWLFLLMPGALPGKVGEQAWIGVLMPSVDRVGRYYPLTLAHPLASVPTSRDELDALWQWTVRLDEAAGDALHDDWSIETLEAQLLRIGTPDTPGIIVGAATSAPQTDAFWTAPERGHTYWHAATGTTAQPARYVANGLRSQRVTQLFGRRDDA